MTVIVIDLTSSSFYDILSLIILLTNNQHSYILQIYRSYTEKEKSKYSDLVKSIHEQFGEAGDVRLAVDEHKQIIHNESLVARE